MLVCFMRHGETDWNAARRLQGRRDIPLNATGLAQVRRAAAELADIHFDRIFSSPLRRARQTAELVAGPRGLTVETEPLLYEIAFGDLEGSTFQQAPAAIFNDPSAYVPPAGGESFYDLLERCGRLLGEFLPSLEDTCGSVLLCSHGALINGVVCRAANRPVEDFWLVQQANCARTWLRCEKGVITLLDNP